MANFQGKVAVAVWLLSRLVQKRIAHLSVCRCGGQAIQYVAALRLWYLRNHATTSTFKYQSQADEHEWTLFMRSFAAKLHITPKHANENRSYPNNDNATVLIIDTTLNALRDP